MENVYVCPGTHKHEENGTCYVTHGCRCAGCRRGRAEYEYWRHFNPTRVAVSVDATGTRRRLQALACLGWSARMIADRFGMAEVTVATWGRAERVSSRTAAKVARWYDELSMRIPEPVTFAERIAVGATRGKAAARGWVPPLAWDDEVIDDPSAEPSMPGVVDESDTLIRAALHGDKPRLPTRELREVIRVLHERRWSGRRIAEHLGYSERTVTRVRAELGLPAYLANADTLVDGRTAA